SFCLPDPVIVGGDYSKGIGSRRDFAVIGKIPPFFSYLDLCGDLRPARRQLYQCRLLGVRAKCTAITILRWYVPGVFCAAGRPHPVTGRSDGASRAAVLRSGRGMNPFNSRPSPERLPMVLRTLLRSIEGPPGGANFCPQTDRNSDREPI